MKELTVITSQRKEPNKERRGKKDKTKETEKEPIRT
tara:strand:+ start:501 stop:608 length:108 start_codon:yes stop_codon:yes gene_type:complete